MALQSVLVVAIVALGVRGPGWADSARWWLKVAAALLVFAGLAVAVSAARALGTGFTTFPAPAERGALVLTGPYAVVRHPVYSGAILFLAGIALALSPWVLVGVAAIAVLWGSRRGSRSGCSWPVIPTMRRTAAHAGSASSRTCTEPSRGRLEAW